MVEGDENDILSNDIKYIKHDLDSFSYGTIISMMQYGSISFKSNRLKNIQMQLTTQ